MKSEKSQTSLCSAFKKALLLNVEFYQNVDDTPKNYRIARTIVILAALSHALGSAVILLINRATILILIIALLIDILAVVGGYYFWTLTIWKIQQKLKQNAFTYREVLIPVGLAYSPQLLNVLTLIPWLGQPIERILAVWTLIGAILAVRQGLQIRTTWATVICLIGWSMVQVAIGFVQVFEQFLAKSGITSNF